MKTEIPLENGKYTIVHENGANLRALRYGESWQDLDGNKLILVMSQEIELLRHQNSMLIESVTKTAEKLGIIEKGLGPVSGQQALVLLEEFARFNESNAESTAGVPNPATESSVPAASSRFSFSRPK